MREREHFDRRRDDNSERDRDGRGSRRRRHSRSRSRSREKHSKREHGDRGRGGYEKEHSNSYKDKDNRDSGNFHVPRLNQEPTSTVMIKGLPPRTTEPTLYAALAAYSPREIRLITQRDGECKGFAFVEFPSVEYATYFMTSFAGSAGDPNAPQLIVENRSVVLEYAREDDRKSKKEGNYSGSGKPHGRMERKSDWLCDKCSCHNFGRRDLCFRCEAPRTENSITVASNSSDPFSEAVVGCDTPSTILAVKGFGLHVNEEQLSEIFRQFAIVKNVQIVRNPKTAMPLSLAFVEFHALEHATFVVHQCGTGLEIEPNVFLKVFYARESMMQQLLTQTMVGSAMAMNPLVQTALQAAQWSTNNGYAGVIQPSGAIPSTGVISPTFPTYSANNTINPMGIPAVGVDFNTQQYPYSTQYSSGSTGLMTVNNGSFWPPIFETNGSSYIFQPKTGYFLEPQSNFYYCPKSKRYYNANEGVYYTFDNSQDSPFQRFDPPLPAESELAATPAQVENNVNSENTGKKEGKPEDDGSQKILSAKRQLLSISIGGSKASGIKGKTSGLSLGGKKTLRDIAKWEAAQQEDEEEEEKRKNDEKLKKSTDNSKSENTNFDGTNKRKRSDSELSHNETKNDNKNHDNIFIRQGIPAPPLPPSTQFNKLPDLINSTSTKPVEKEKVQNQPEVKKAGVPSVCLLCRRQFPSEDMLKRHEKESKLHAENLKKQNISL